MPNEELLNMCQIMQTYNYVMYDGKIAMITGSKQAEKYPISVRDDDGSIKVKDVLESELDPIKLDESFWKVFLEEIRQHNLNSRDNLTPFGCTFSCKVGGNNYGEVKIAFDNNYCEVIQNGERVFAGVVSEFHVLQNIVREILGHIFFLPKGII